MEEQEDFSVAPIALDTAKADERQLGTLHGIVSEYLTQAIATGRAPPALIGAAITFLKNNSITADANTNAKLSALKEQLAGKRTRGLTRRDMNDAAKAFESMLPDMGLPQ